MRYITAVLILLTASGITPVFADEVHFTNNDKLTGKVLYLVDGELFFASDLAGDVKIDVKSLSLITTDSEVEIHLKDGRVVFEKLYVTCKPEEPAEDVGIRMAEPVYIDDITSVNPPPEPKPSWKGSITTGANSTSGNSSSTTINTAFNLERDADKNRITTKGNYNYGRQKDNETGETSTAKDSWFFESQYDHFFKEKTSIYVNGRIGQDHVADLDLRTILGFGFGHQWIETDDFEYSMSGGLAWMREMYAESESNSDLSAQIAYKLEKKINDNLSFIHDLTWFPVIKNFDDYFITSQAELKSTLTNNMFASLKIALEYDASPAEDADQTDLQYILGFGFNLD